MKKILFFLFFGVLVQSQITYLSTDFAAVGHSQNTITTAALTTYNFTQTGTNFTWDYSALSTPSSTTTSFIDPNNAGYKTYWCLYHSYIFNCNSQFNAAFNLAQTLPSNYSIGGQALTNAYLHYNKSTSQLALKMIAGQIMQNGTNTPFFVEYTQPDILYQFPITYGTTYTNPNSINMNLNPLGVNVLVNSTGSRTNTVEGWGSLSIPGKVFPNVLKLKSVLTQNIQINNNGVSSTQNINQTSYQWFSKDSKIPVLIVNGTETNGIFVPESATFPQFVILGTSEISLSDIEIYPNPVRDFLYTSLPQESIKSIEIYSMTGQLVGKGFKVSHLPSGSYLLVIKTKQKTWTKKFIKTE